MADQVVPLSSADVAAFAEALAEGDLPGTPHTIGKRLRDMGDGTHAEVLALGAVSESLVIAPTTAVDTNAYQADDALTGVLTLTNAARVAGGKGRIVWSQILDLLNANTALVIEAFVFNVTPAGAAAANAPHTFSDADMAAIQGRILFADHVAIGVAGSVTSRHYQSDRVVPFTCASGSRDLFVQLILRSGTPTFGATTQIVPSFRIEQDS
jgi:hypothetical protein